MQKNALKNNFLVLEVENVLIFQIYQKNVMILLLMVLNIKYFAKKLPEDVILILMTIMKENAFL